MKVNYVTIPADPRKDTDGLKQILEMLKQGYKILSAVGVAGGVHYILGKKENHG